MNVAIIIFIIAGYIASFAYMTAAASDEATSRRIGFSVVFSAFATFFLVLLVFNSQNLQPSDMTAGRIVPLAVPSLLFPIAAGIVAGLLRRKNKKKKAKEPAENPPDRPAPVSAPKPAAPAASKAAPSPVEAFVKSAPADGKKPAPRTYSHPNRETHIQMATNDLCGICARGALAANSQWIRAVGQDLNDAHGFSAMQETYFNVMKRYPIYGSQLSQIWDGVGDWAD